jgi:hypothetical protein
MPNPAVAIGGSALVGAGASIFGANKASKSAKDAAKEQTKATYAAIAAEKDALNKQIGLQEPFREVGVNALSQYAGASAPSYKPFGMEQFNADPGYQFRMSEGMKALERSASARGILSSGQTLKDITRFGQDTASQEYQNAFTRYMAETQRMREEKMAPLEYQIGLGQAAASNQAANIGTSAGSTSNLLTGLGNIGAARSMAQGNAYTGAANTIGSLATGGANAYGQYMAAQPYQNYLSSITPTNSAMGFASPGQRA